MKKTNNLFTIPGKQEKKTMPDFYVKAILRFMSKDPKDFEIIETETFNTKMGIEKGFIGFEEEGVDLEYELKNADLEITPNADEIHQILWGFNTTTEPVSYYDCSEWETEIETVHFKTHKLSKEDIKILTEIHPEIKGFAI